MVVRDLQSPGTALQLVRRSDEWGQRSRIRKNWPNAFPITSIHQFFELCAPDMPIRLRRMEAAFSAAEGF